MAADPITAPCGCTETEANADGCEIGQAYYQGRSDGIRATLARLADSYLITRGDPAGVVAALRAELLPEERADTAGHQPPRQVPLGD